MSKTAIFTMESNTRIAKDIFEMVLCGDTSEISRPGQFVNIQLEGLYLRRPISIADYDENRLTLVYKTVGKGTAKLSTMEAGQKLDLLLPLGNGFDVERGSGAVAVIGGGVGTPPMYKLCKALLAKGLKPVVVLGFASKDDVFYQEKFEALGLTVHIATADGSFGTKGFVTHVLQTLPYDYYFTCGPAPMLEAVLKLGKEGQLSFEERMGCGFGACMGCSCQTKYGNKRICVEGPVLLSEEVICD